MEARMSENEPVPNHHHGATAQQQGGVFIGPQSWVPLGAVAAAFLALLGVKSWLDSQFADLRTQMLSLQQDVKEVRGAVADRWTGSDMALWVERMARANPGLQVPPVDQTRRER